MGEEKIGDDSTPAQGRSRTAYAKILAELDIAREQRNKRIALLEALSSPELNDGEGPHGVVSHVSRFTLSSEDIGILADVLLGIGDVKTLNLILESPGGDGTQVEKFVSLCRSSCKRFRVIIPNEAKSAATLISLGADEIVMGPCSELGPIDAQIEAMVAGVPRFISAQSFIDARDDLLQRHAECKNKGEDVEAILQMITTLDLPLIAECVRMMDFGRDVGKKLLCEHMFASDADRDAKSDKIVAQLSSVDRYKVHGRLINGQMARGMGLNVKIGGYEDTLWKTSFEYYQRASIALGRESGLKIFETSHDCFIARFEG